MFGLPDIETLRQCSALASTAFAAVYLALWYGRRDEAHLLHWTASSALYVAALIGLDLSSHAPAENGLLYALLSASTILVLSGLRLFEGRPVFAPWMALLALATGLAFLLPALLVDDHGRAARIGGTLGLAAGMTAIGGVLAFGRAARPSRGRRIAGGSLLAYLPFYALAIADEVLGPSTVNMCALLPMLADQVLLAVLNLGLIAVPWESAQMALREAATRDPLTGALNRAGFAAQAPRLLRPGTALLVIDVDHFKAINDGHGHAAGDRVLVSLVALARALVPDEAAIARLGGDEFAVLLPEASLAEARALADALRRAVRRAAGPPVWTVSLGVAAVAPTDASFDEVLARADASLYRAKAGGRDRAAA